MGDSMGSAARGRAATRAALVLLCTLVLADCNGSTLAGRASAAPSLDPLGFRFDAPSYVVHETDGQATIAVIRSIGLAGQKAWIRFIAQGLGVPCGTGPCTAVDPYDFHSVKDTLEFLPGVTSMTFTVPIVNHGTTSVPKTIALSLFGPSPIGMGSPSKAILTIINDAPVTPRDPLNPLELLSGFRSGNPLAGARFFVDPQSDAANAARRYPAIKAIAAQPGAERFGSFSYGSPFVPTIGIAVSRYLTRAAAQSPGTIPLLATYRIVHGSGRNGDSPAEVAAYHTFIGGFAQGIGSYPAVLFLEMDSLITAPSLNARGLNTRINELRDAINVLTSTCPHLVIYLDAGAADAVRARDAANLLKRAGVAKIQGFALNTTHFDWTRNEIRYGNEISRMTGGKHFVVNTGTNGRGPLRPHDIVKNGMEVLCNPKGRGLGPKPNTRTGSANVDMFAWTTNPGESGGQCHDQPDLEMQGAPRTGVYWPAYALMLIRNADYRIR